MSQASLRQTLLFFAFLATLWFAFLGLRKLISPDEGRYATLAWEMVSSGDWLTPRLNGVKYFEKPALQYWGAAALFSALGFSDFVARLYPALTGFMAIVAVFFTGQRLWGRGAGLLGALILASSFWWVANGHFLSLDMGVSAYLCLVLCAFIWGQNCSATEQRNAMLAAWAAMALAVLQKGLIGIVIPGATVVLYTLASRDWRIWTRLHLFKGILLFLAICAPWFVLVSRANPEFARFFFIHEHFDRFLKPDHDRAGPLWYFLPILLAGILPWLSLLPAMLKEGLRRENQAFQTRIFLLVWVVFIFAFFSKSSSKLPSYILPLFPALALLAAPLVDSLDARRLRWHGVTALLLGLLLIAAGFIVPGLKASAERAALLQALAGWLLAGGVVATVCAVVGIWFLGRQQKMAGLIALALTTLLGAQIAATGHDAFSKTNSSWHMVAAAAAHITPKTEFYAFRTYDQTLAFYLKRRLQLVEYRDEFSFGQKQEAERYMSLETFRPRWLESVDAMMLVDPKTWAVLQAENWPGHILYKTEKRMLVKR